jgi:glucosamine-6-phosphate deaminase
MLESVQKKPLEIRVFETRQLMGKNAAEAVSTRIRYLLNSQPFVNIVFAAAPSQEEFLKVLSENTDIEWWRVNAFHMDEYINIASDAPQAFGNFLKQRIFSKLLFHTVNYINGNAESITKECERYSALLKKYPADIVCMGIGENAHIAFNDPHVADFNDKKLVKEVELDEDCRQQQVNDGCFQSLSEVPVNAITVTIPPLLNARFIYCLVPGKTKARAVFNTLNEKVSELYPSSILRTHPNAILFLDKESGANVKM